jgi:type I restriction-modification system DNA methylase subunit
MVAIVDPQEGEMVYGPVCGTGGVCPAQSRCGSFLSNLWAGAYAACSDQEGFAVVGSLEAIAANDYSLSIPLYVKRPAAAAEGEGGGQTATLQEAWQTWEVSGQELWQQMDGVVAMLDGLVGEVSFTEAVKENQE